MILSVIVINISRTHQSKTIPHFIQNALDGNFGKYLGLHRINIKVRIETKSRKYCKLKLTDCFLLLFINKLFLITTLNSLADH